MLERAGRIVNGGSRDRRRMKEQGATGQIFGAARAAAQPIQNLGKSGAGRILQLLKNRQSKDLLKKTHERLASVEGMILALMHHHPQAENEVLEKISRLHMREALESGKRPHGIRGLEKKAAVKLAQAEKRAKKNSPAKAKAQSSVLEKITGTEEPHGDGEPHGHGADENGATGAKSSGTVHDGGQDWHALEAAAISHEVKVLRLVTDFDRVLDYIGKKGRAGYGEISEELKVPLNRVDECCSILRDEGQAQIIYPPFGRPYAQALGYVPPKKEKAKAKVLQ